MEKNFGKRISEKKFQKKKILQVQGQGQKVKGQTEVQPEVFVCSFMTSFIVPNSSHILLIYIYIHMYQVSGEPK